MLLNEVPCTVCAIVQDQKVIELRLEPSGKKNTLNNIYVGQVENIAANIQAAFVRLSDSVNGYLPLNQCTNAIYTDRRKTDQPLRPGDQLLVQINREAMKGKLPALTANLNFSGKYLVLTTGNRKIGFSNKLSKEESSLLNKWLEEERSLPEREYGIIARTNAAEASKEEFLPFMDGTVPVTVFYMKQNHFIWQQFAMSIPEIWMRLLLIFLKYMKRSSLISANFSRINWRFLSCIRINYFHYISFTVWRVRSMKYAMKRSG